MEPSEQSEAVIRRVRQLLDSGFFQLPSAAQTGPPLPVLSPDGTIHSWVVPFTAADRIVAWAQLLPSLEPMRFSAFAGEKPEAAEWLDPAAILYRIAAVAGPGQHLSHPILTYDRDPSRLVWQVDSYPPPRRWHSAGGQVWQAPEGNEEVTG